MYFYRHGINGSAFHIIELALIIPKKELDNFQRYQRLESLLGTKKTQRLEFKMR